MQRRTRLSIAAAVVAAVSVAAASFLWPHLDPSIPTLQITDGQTVGCEMAESQRGVIHGDRWSVPHVWLDVDGRRYDPVWPPGYSARFTPALELVSGSGKVVAREGDVISLEPERFSWTDDSRLVICPYSLPS